MPSRLRVPAGYVLGVLALALARPSLRSLLWAVPLVLCGEAIRLWASGHLEKTWALATGGPYAHSRNPLYLGSALMAVGLAAASASPWVVVAVVGYFLAFFPRVVREEAAFLRDKFKPDYEEWAGEVPIFWPRLRPGGPRATRFEWRRVGVNREWRTAAALPAVAALLYLRGRWPG